MGDFEGYIDRQGRAEAGPEAAEERAGGGAVFPRDGRDSEQPAASRKRGSQGVCRPLRRAVAPGLRVPGAPWKPRTQARHAWVSAGRLQTPCS